MNLPEPSAIILQPSFVATISDLSNTHTGISQCALNILAMFTLVAATKPCSHSASDVNEKKKQRIGAFPKEDRRFVVSSLRVPVAQL